MLTSPATGKVTKITSDRTYYHAVVEDTSNQTATLKTDHLTFQTILAALRANNNNARFRFSGADNNIQEIEW